MSLEKRKQLRMCIKDAISPHQLRKEVIFLIDTHTQFVYLCITQLEVAKIEAQETKDTVKLKYVWFGSVMLCNSLKYIRYVPIEKKFNLQQELLSKEV